MENLGRLLFLYRAVQVSVWKISVDFCSYTELCRFLYGKSRETFVLISSCAGFCMENLGRLLFLYRAVQVSVWKISVDFCSYTELCRFLYGKSRETFVLISSCAGFCMENLGRRLFLYQAVQVSFEKSRETFVLIPSWASFC